MEKNDGFGCAIEEAGNKNEDEYNGMYLNEEACRDKTRFFKKVKDNIVIIIILRKEGRKRWWI